MLIIVAVVIIGTFWKVFRQHSVNNGSSSILSLNNSTQKTTSLPTGPLDSGAKLTTYTYPGNYFKLSYPSSWTLTTQPTYNGGPFSERLNITPPQAPQLFAGATEAVTVSVFQSLGLKSAISRLATAPTPSKSQYLTINGNRALFQQYTLSPNSETHIDDNYAITNGTVTVEFYFRVSESAMPASGNLPAVAAVNEQSLLPQFNSIVASLQF